MADLISRTAAIEAIYNSMRYGEGYKGVCTRAIERIPSVDAVPVIRCRDCEHFIDMSGTSYPSYCYKHSTFDVDGEFDNAFCVEPNKYCAWGERRDSE